MNIKKMIVVSAILVTMTPADVQAVCDVGNVEAHRNYSAISARLDAATARFQQTVTALQGHIAPLKTASDAYVAAAQALAAKNAQEPQPARESNSEWLRWKADAQDLTAARERALDAFKQTFGNLGMAWSGQGHFVNVRTKAIEYLRTLPDLTAAAQFETVVNAVGDPPQGFDRYAVGRIWITGSAPLGLLGNCRTADDEVKRIKREQDEYGQRCPVGAAMYEVNVLQGRNGDGTAIVDNRDNPQAGTTGNTTQTNGRNGVGSLTGESRNTTSTNNVTTTSGNVTGTTANVTGTTGNTTRTSTDTYTVRPGDNLTRIARELAPQLGNPPISELVRRLYANMTTRSRSNPNLIFAGDTINVAAVRAELQG